MSEKSGVDLGNIVMIGALIVGGYFVLKYIMPALKGLGGVAEAVGKIPEAVLPTTPLETVGAVPGASVGLVVGGPVGAVIGSAIGKELAPNTPEQVVPFTVAGALGGIGGPIGIIVATQVAKALTPKTTIKTEAVITTGGGAKINQIFPKTVKTETKTIQSIVNSLNKPIGMIPMNAVALNTKLSKLK